MKSYGQFCPVAKACEIVAERWTPLVLRELLCGSTRFSELQRGVPLMSRTLLTQRLRELEDAGVVASTPRARGRGREYRLTPAGEEVRSVIVGLGEWGQRWARRQIAPDDLDAELLAWDMHRRLNVDRLPTQRVVVRFDLRGVPRHQPGRKTWWLVLTRPEVDLCLKDPGFEVDLTVDADLMALTRVWMGDMRLQDAVRGELIRPDGPRALVRAFPTWFGLSLFAGVERPAVVSAHVPGRGRLARAAHPGHHEAPRPGPPGTSSLGSRTERGRRLEEFGERRRAVRRLGQPLGADPHPSRERRERRSDPGPTGSEGTQRHARRARGGLGRRSYRSRISESQNTRRAAPVLVRTLTGLRERQSGSRQIITRRGPGMKRNRLVALIGVVIAWGAEVAHGKECAGVAFPDQAQVNGNTLTLNGLGLRQATMLKVNIYVAALYVAKASTDPYTILGSNAPKQLVLHFVRNVGSGDLSKAWDEGFASNAKDQLPALRERIETLKGWMADMRSGERITFIHLPGAGIRVDVSGTTKGTVKGDDFARAFLSIWLGAHPPNSGLKAGVLGGACG